MLPALKYFQVSLLICSGARNESSRRFAAPSRRVLANLGYCLNTSA